MADRLPIEDVLPDLMKAFAGARNVVLSAAPGAGKTTRVPLALLQQPWLGGQKIIMLEPRRLAAQRAAQYMASLLGEEVGETVGYRIRGESRAGRHTRLEVVTEGILTRLLQSDPSLAGVGMVIFDEFHERSVHADLGLALALDAQTHLRNDLCLLVMSATLEGVAVAGTLGEAPVIASTGRSFPVDTRYLSFPVDGSIELKVMQTVLRALREGAGNLLVFLPGRREIVRVEGLLNNADLPERVDLFILHGEGTSQEQQAALAPALPGRRKVILSTSIAETSLTIDGVRIVVDAGLARVPRFDPRRGMSGLATVQVSQANATQRCGRAGRQAPGICYRLWTEEQQERLPRFLPPEIMASDLAPLALELACWGAPNGEGLRFLDPPPAPHLVQAHELLRALGALDAAGRPTSHGRAMADLPVHPRYAHMIIRGRELHCGALACDVAALLEERDLLRGRDKDIDLASRWHVLKRGGGAEQGTRTRIQQQSRRLRSMAGVRGNDGNESDIGVLVALAYPERVARRRGQGSERYQLVSGTGAILPSGSLLARQEFLAIADVDGLGLEARVFLAAPLEREQILEQFADQIVTEEELRWDPREEAVVARRTQRLGALIVTEQQVRPEGEQLRAAILEGIRQMGLQSLPWDQHAASIRTRSEWLRMHGLAPAGWPDLSDATLLVSLERWLGPFIDGMTRKAHLARLDMTGVLHALLTHDQLRTLDRLAPTHLTLHSGLRAKLDYAAGDTPVLAVKLQQMFGETETPVIAGGKVKVLLHLLSPANRPLAVTQDLKSFWKNVYPEVRKQMRGRYPKHRWPEEPGNGNGA